MVGVGSGWVWWWLGLVVGGWRLVVGVGVGSWWLVAGVGGWWLVVEDCG